MPIKDRSLYPANWDEISRQVRQAAGNRCQECGVFNHSRGYRLGSGQFLPVMEDSVEALQSLGYKVIRIVLTVSHLDHDPANCAPENLRALCQRCHLRYDRFEHGRNAAETRRRKAVRA
jgi:hypothetical protein